MPLFAKGQVVMVSRRISAMPGPNPHLEPREWVEAEVADMRISHSGGVSYMVAFRDGYRGPRIYSESRLAQAQIKSESIVQPFAIGDKVRLRPDMMEWMAAQGKPLRNPANEPFIRQAALVDGKIVNTMVNGYEGGLRYQVDFGHLMTPDGVVFKKEHLVMAPKGPAKKMIPEVCPKCGDAGHWVMCGLTCRQGHGVFQG